MNGRFMLNKINQTGLVKTTLGTVFLLALTLSFQAEAKRYLVVLKSEQTYRQVQSQFQKSQRQRNEFSLSGVNLTLGETSVKPFEGVNAKVEQSLTHLKTLVVDAKSAKDIKKMAKDPSVLLIEEETFIPAPKPIGGMHLYPAWDYSLNASMLSSPSDLGVNTPWGIKAVKAPEAWATAHSGNGARVLVLDTGIDHDHPAVKANFEQGKDFVHDNITPYPYADKVGHGTHVAGTIGASVGAYGFVGVAPEAKILAGRVCSDQGCSNISIAEGINWGIEQKVDVINMSLGGAMSTSSEKQAIIAAEKAGVIIVAAAGNDGTPKVGYPAALPNVIAVGAVDSSLKRAQFSQYGPELFIVAPGVEVVSSVPLGTARAAKVNLKVGDQTQDVPTLAFYGSMELKSPLSGDLILAGKGKVEDLAGKSMVGRIALVQRGEISFQDKAKNVLKSGAKGMIVYNTEPGLFKGAISKDSTTMNLAAFLIEKEVGEKLVLQMTNGAQASAQMSIDPADYDSYAGTSMATPHVAGVVALIKATNKKLTPAQVRSILKETAVPTAENNTQNEYGNGLVDAQAACAKAATLH